MGYVVKFREIFDNRVGGYELELIQFCFRILIVAHVHDIERMHGIQFVDNPQPSHALVDVLLIHYPTGEDDGFKPCDVEAAYDRRCSDDDPFFNFLNLLFGSLLYYGLDIAVNREYRVFRFDILFYKRFQKVNLPLIINEDEYSVMVPDNVFNPFPVDFFNADSFLFLS